MSFFQKIIKNIKKQKFKGLVFSKSARRVWNHLYFNLKKNARKTLNFFKNLIFAFLNPKTVKW